MNIVLFGSGAIAREHVLAIRALQASQPDLHLYGVYSPRPGSAAAFAAEHELPHAAEHPRVFLDDVSVDVVLVCSPSAIHAVQTRAALDAGKHVLCEIPLALSLDEAIELRDLARRQRRTLMVAHTNRYSPPLRALHDRIASGELHPTAIVARYLFLRRSNIGWTGRQRSWTDNLLWHHGGHAADLCLWLLGAQESSVVSVVSEAAPPHPELGIPLDLSLIVRISDGRMATIAMSYNSEAALHDYTVIGQEATFRVTPAELRNAAGELVLANNPGVNPILALDADFFAAIRTGAPAPIDVDAVLPSLTALQRAADAAGLVPTAEEERQAAAERDLLDSTRRL
jgi:2-hydroxy-4-carboxymuconate semialdehyde hemiacetal dehydrogenase